MRRPVNDHLIDHIVISAKKRHLATHEIKQNDAEGENIGILAVPFLLTEHLRGHVAHSAYAAAYFGRLASRVVFTPINPHSLAKPRQLQIKNKAAPLDAHKYIRGLNIPVDYVVLVAVFDRLSYFPKNKLDVRLVELRAIGVEVLPQVHVGGICDHVEVVLLYEKVNKCQNIWVVQVIQQISLVNEINHIIFSHFSGFSPLHSD